jgi:hypothetical protein
VEELLLSIEEEKNIAGDIDDIELDIERQEGRI